MKRILSILLVALTACGAVFAEFSFSGEFETGYQLNFDGSFEANNWINGDSDAPWATFITLNGSSDWASIAIRGEVDTTGISYTLDKSDSEEDDDPTAGITDNFIRGNLAAQGTLHVTQMLNTVFGVESPVSVDLLVGNWKFSADDGYGYYDPTGAFNEISVGNRRTLNAGAQIKYQDIVDFVIAADFIENPIDEELDSYFGNGIDKAVLLDLKVAPVDGVKAEVAYAISKESGDDFQLSAVADIGALMDADFSAGVSAAMSARLDDTYSDNADYYATVFGGAAGVTGYVEYAYEDKISDVNFGAQYDITDVKLPTSIGLDMTVGDLTKEKGDIYFGAELWGTTQILDTTVALWLGADNFSELQDTGYVGLGCFLTF